MQFLEAFGAIHGQLDQKGDSERKSRRSGLLAVVAATLVASACSDGALRSPAGPSSLTAGPEATAAADWAANRGWSTAADGLMVEGSDVATAVSGTCPDRVITVRGVPVVVNSGTMFGSGISCSALTAGMTVRIRGLLTLTAGAYSVIATAVSVDQPPAEGSGPGGGTGTVGSGRREHVSGEGTVANLTGTCPSLSMVIRGVRVHTSAATEFVNGACGDLRNGTKVEVAGDRNGDGSLDATRLLSK